MRRLVRWWRALLALGSEPEYFVYRTNVGPVTDEKGRRAFFKLVDEGLSDLSHDRRRKSEAS